MGTLARTDVATVLKAQHVQCFAGAEGLCNLGSTGLSSVLYFSSVGSLNLQFALDKGAGDCRALRPHLVFCG